MLIIHTVKSGETVSSIARLYGVSPTLLALNNGIDGYLVVGEDLVVQIPKVTHTVGYDETLHSIARMHGITEREIFQNNYYLKGNSTIYPGQTIVISYEDEPEKEIISNGYAYPFVRDSVLKSALPFVTYLSPFTYGTTYNGSLLNLNDEGMIAQAKSYGTKAALHLSTLAENDVFDRDLATNILNNMPAQDRLIAEIDEMMKRKGFEAIDVDFEFLNASDAEKYAEFIKRVEGLGYPTIVAVAPKTSREQKGQLYEGHDYRLLGEAADYLFVMTYEWGYTYGPPMAVSPLPSVKKVLDFAITEADPSKIWLGLSNYGYDWTLPFVRGESKARSIGNREAVDLARQYNAEIMYDEVAQAPYFNYKDEMGLTHEVWFEDAKSMKAKLDLINEYGFSGVGIWNLMREFPQLWIILNAMYK